ncbi:hypothetical protein FA95DRAFT_1613529 [Auriscalpium vulgare]|uniref:Uncharacterized protein n=1 Tax=Auriscalpium vulgare TaxID=40419 RepID=A0ACB8R2D2_9AGAM|nr:hypothetical protein FA95DRAFT_1613529 [Auriscalpium vulgare]
MNTKRGSATTNRPYYHRKREERRLYQKLYYEAHKGRRKVSKAARLSITGRCRREQAGERSSYHCQLSHSDPTDDPRRDTDTEVRLDGDCVTLRDSLRDQLQVSEEGWVPEFVSTVQQWINKYVDEAQNLITNGTVADGLRLHHLRRFVAGLRQEQELASQGRGSRRAALEDLRLILWGRRVNMDTFSELYGW